MNHKFACPKQGMAIVPTCLQSVGHCSPCQNHFELIFTKYVVDTYGAKISLFCGSIATEITVIIIWDRNINQKLFQSENGGVKNTTEFSYGKKRYLFILELFPYSVKVSGRVEMFKDDDSRTLVSNNGNLGSLFTMHKRSLIIDYHDRKLVICSLSFYLLSSMGTS